MSYILRFVGIVCSVVVSVVLTGSGVASAKDGYIGKTYAEVAASITGNNGKPIIATVTGSQLATNDCIVVDWQRGIYRDSSGDKRRGEYMLNLNCNRVLASPGHPGNSLSSPEGRQEKKDERTARRIAKNPTICDENADAGHWCARICEKTGLCDYEL
jgi:hypothetical protein